MEIIKQKEIYTLTSLTGSDTTVVPYKLSRSKALNHVKEKSTVGKELAGIPEKQATDLLYVLFVKIGATKELPSGNKSVEAYLNDFWATLYLHNNLCPADIPFDIIINNFTMALVHGTVDRMGNNQAAICTAFNSWITRQDVRNRLYEIRNRLYPNRKPKELPKNATEKTIADYSDQELLQKISDIKPMAGIAMVDNMLIELHKETTKRGLK